MSFASRRFSPAGLRSNELTFASFVVAVNGNSVSIVGTNAIVDTGSE